MSFFQSLMLYFCTIAIILQLIAGGWVRIRDYFRNKAKAKSEAAELVAKAQADAIEAAVQERLKKLQEDAAKAPEATSTSTTGPALA